MDFVADNWDDRLQGKGAAGHWRSCIALAILLVQIPFGRIAAASPPPSASSLRNNRFNHITVEQGLTDQRVQAILQDRAGFMWFGTSNGLDRFDGYRIVAYRADATNPFSLSGNLITDLLEDRNGALWVATRSGLNLFDPRTERFTRYVHDPANPKSLSDNTVFTIHEDRDGVLWVGTLGGVNRFDSATGTITRYRHDPTDPRSLAENAVQAMYEDRSGALWVGTFGGLDRLDRATGTFTHYRHDAADPDSLSHDVVWDILEDRRGRLWVATDGGGLERFDRDSGKFIHHRHDPANPSSLTADRVDSLYEDASGAIWVGTFGGGLSVLDPERGTFVNHRHDPRAPTSLSADYIAVIAGERSGMIWLGLQGGGVDVYNPDAQSFSVLEPLQGAEKVDSPSVWSLHEGRGGELWLGTQGQGLVRLDRQTGAVVHYRPDPANPLALRHPWISDIAGEPAGPLWLGTYGGGLFRLDPALGVFTNYRNDPANPRSLSNDNVVALHIDRSGVLWIGTRGGGVNRFDPVRGEFTSFRNDPDDSNSLSHDWIGEIIDSADGKLWVGTRGGGLNLLEPATGRITRFRHDARNPRSLADDSVATLHVDRAGVLWVGLSSAGLERFDPATGTFTHYRQRDGLPSDRVVAIVEDGDDGDRQAGELWISTGRGLAKLDRDRKTVVAFDAGDGLPLTEFNPGHARSRSGEIMLASADGMIYFEPATVKGDPLPPPIVFTSLHVANKPVSIGGDSPLQQVVNLTDKIELKYSDRVVSLEFAALSYRAPQNSRYRYILEGFDSHWNEVDGTRRLVTYTNLDPGSYLFRVVAANADGVWNRTGRTLALIITPPWWATWWFRVLAFCVIVGSALSVYQLRKRSRNRQWAALEAEILERRRAEMALRDSEARYRGIVEDQTELICRVLPDGTHTFVNGEYCRYFQRRPEELLGSTFWQFVPPEEQPALRAHLASITVDSPVATIEHRVKTPDGVVRCHQWTDRGIFDKDGRLLEYQSVGRDVTERVRAEEEHRQLVAQKVVEAALRNAAQRKDEFLAMLAHELRNPLAPVTLAVEILRTAPPLDRQADWAREVIARQVKQMSRLVDDLLDVSRISRGKIILRKETVDLRAVVNQAIETSRPLVDRRGHELVTSLPDSPVLVDGDAVRLAQVVANLLNNAAKYSEPGAHIHVELRRRGLPDQAVITVRDSGVGIPKEMLPRVFEAFTQLDETRERAEGGLGIGLTLVKRLVEMHGGTVEAASAGRGLGSEFSVSLPALAAGLHLAAGSGEPPRELAILARSSESLRILVVDDNVDAADGLAELLTMWRHTPFVVHDGMAALEAALQFSPDVVLLDLGLPKLDGLEVARRLREATGHMVPVLVALTGYGQPEDHRRTSEAGFDHHLIKPVQPAVLRDVLAQVHPRRAGTATTPASPRHLDIH